MPPAFALSQDQTLRFIQPALSSPSLGNQNQPNEQTQLKPSSNPQTRRTKIPPAQTSLQSVTVNAYKIHQQIPSEATIPVQDQANNPTPRNQNNSPKPPVPLPIRITKQAKGTANVSLPSRFQFQRTNRPAAAPLDQPSARRGFYAAQRVVSTPDFRACSSPGASPDRGGDSHIHQSSV